MITLRGLALPCRLTMHLTFTLLSDRYANYLSIARSAIPCRRDKHPRTAAQGPARPASPPASRGKRNASRHVAGDAQLRAACQRGRERPPTVTLEAEPSAMDSADTPCVEGRAEAVPAPARPRRQAQPQQHPGTPAVRTNDMGSEGAEAEWPRIDDAIPAASQGEVATAAAQAALDCTKMQQLLEEPADRLGRAVILVPATTQGRAERAACPSSCTLEFPSNRLVLLTH